MNEDNDHGAELIGQAIPDMEGTEPRPTFKPEQKTVVADLVERERVIALIQANKRHVEASPGVGAEAQTYALACYDDLIQMVERLR